MVQACAPQLIADLAGLVRIPSVSWDGFDPTQLELAAQRVAELCETTGVFDTVGIHRHSGGAPAVIARREPMPGWPTVVLYAHLDVQPPGLAEEWVSPPYQPTLRNGRLYGRGSADDKAGIAVHLAAIRALALEDADELNLGIVMFIEGEEENGSPSFEGFIGEFADSLSGDIIVVADSDNPSPEIPAITTSLRGNVTTVISLGTLDHAVHSGMLGGAVPDAMMAFSVVAGSFYDAAGSLAIEGLASTGSAADPEGPAHTPVGPEAGLLPGVAEIGHGSVQDRLWRQPALTITGLDLPSVEHASNTLIPQIRAKLSLRVAPGSSATDALAALERHLQKTVPFGAHWSLGDTSLGEPFEVDVEAPALDIARIALEAGFGQPVVFQGVGGSIPFISQLASRFPAANIVITGVEDPDTRAHSPNESLHLGVLWRQVLSESVLLSLLNRLGPSELPGFGVVE